MLSPPLWPTHRNVQHRNVQRCRLGGGDGRPPGSLSPPGMGLGCCCW